MATVTDKGVVKALKKGTVVITVRTANGRKATCRITVKQELEVLTPDPSRTLSCYTHGQPSVVPQVYRITP